MKRAIRNAVLAAFVVLGFVVSNALVDTVMNCQCRDDCWCKTSIGRHLRWWTPGRWHRLRSADR
jgi:hypothetical protein